MSADFWAGYISGATGILIGNPLDLIKTRLQAGHVQAHISANPATEIPRAWSWRAHFDKAGTLVRGTTAPLLTYGALNALLFVSYNRTLTHLTSSPYPPGTSTPNPLSPSSSSSSSNPLSPSAPPSLPQIYLAGALAGFTTFLISAPTELIKCRTQVSRATSISSWRVARETWRQGGLREMYYGGGVTSVRDAVGYGFYFLSYEWSKRALHNEGDSSRTEGMKVLLCGGFAGIVTWASIFPLDVIKTRLQVQVLSPLQVSPSPATSSSTPLLATTPMQARLSTLAIARQAYRNEGVGIFFRGLGICSVRAFVVNAVQWAVYEWVMKMLKE